jgi:hypothetical protein
MAGDNRPKDGVASLAYPAIHVLSGWKFRADYRGKALRRKPDRPAWLTNLSPAENDDSLAL